MINKTVTWIILVLVGLIAVGFLTLTPRMLIILCCLWVLFILTDIRTKVCAQALAEHPEYRVENLGALPDKDQAVQNTASSDIATHIQQAVSQGDICEMCKDNFKLAVRNYQAALMAKGLDRTDTNKTMLAVMNEVNAETKSKNFVQ